MFRRYLVLLVVGVILMCGLLTPAMADGPPYTVRLTVRAGDHTFVATSCTLTHDGAKIAWNFNPPITLWQGEEASRVSNPLPWKPNDFHMFYQLDTFPKKIDIETGDLWYGEWYPLCSNPVPAEMMLEEIGQIPTLTEWGLIIFGVVLLGFITWVFLKRRKAVVEFTAD